MSSVTVIKKQYKLLGANKTKLELFSLYVDLLPTGVTFDQPKWDLLEWHVRKGNRDSYMLHFDSIQNPELMLAAKFYVLDRRQASKLSVSSLEGYVRAIVLLGDVLGQRKLATITNADFFETENLMKERFKGAYRQAAYLEVFARWLNQNFGVRINYESQLHHLHSHGRKGTEEGRKAKRLSLEVIRELVAAANREDLNKKDRFFLAAFTINVGCGFRINELATLPNNPLVKNGEDFLLRYFAEKGGKLDVRPIPTAIVSAVESAISYITSVTEPGRKLVSQLHKGFKITPRPDWTRVLSDEKAAKYFSEKFAHDWTANPMHDLFSKLGAWSEKNKEYLDVLGLIKEHGSIVAVGRKIGMNRSTIARLKCMQESALRDELPIANFGKKATAQRNEKQKSSWDTDSRVISIVQFEKYANKTVNVGGRRELIRGVIDGARLFQLQGKIYPNPTRNDLLEDKFMQRINAVVESKDGKRLLEARDALFVIRKFEFARNTDPSQTDYSLIDDSMFCDWLNGQKRAHGTANHEDTIFNRLNIRDPESDKIAKFTWHDIRHWLHTTYAEGGLSEQQLGLVFSRKPISNHTYDQTSSTTRLENLRSAIRSKTGMGVMQETYNRLAEYSREEGESYLEAKTIMIRVMPHGGCVHNFAAAPCPNHNSCFVREEIEEDGLCEHLILTFASNEQIVELKRLYDENALALAMLPENSRQYHHAMKVKGNLDILFDSLPNSDNDDADRKVQNACKDEVEKVV